MYCTIGTRFLLSPYLIFILINYNFAGYVRHLPIIYSIIIGLAWLYNHLLNYPIHAA